MLTPEENDLLCRVEGDAPMGQIMRRHWTPACLSEELPEPDGKPIRIRLLGENLVAFRDSEGKVGVLDELCPHRKASLVYGRNEECGLRCLYHGWKFDVNGTVLETPSEPEGSNLIEKVSAKAYPVEELAGFIWVWMGDPAAVRPFERPPFSPTEDARVSIAKIRVPANWAQITEGQIDSSHSSSLHSSDMKPARIEGAGADAEKWYRPSTDKSPKMQSEITDYGFHYAAIRRPIKNAAQNDYIRVTEYVAPYISLIPPNNQYNVTSVIVPIDDENTMFHFIAWGTPDLAPDTDTWRKFLFADPGVDIKEDWSAVRDLSNDFLQDRAFMKEGDFTGVKGIPNQDSVMWVSMGPIVDRSTDILGASDMAVVEFRRLMVQAAKDMRDGKGAIGDKDRRPIAEVASFEGVVPKAEDWRGMGRVAGLDEAA